MCNVDMKAKTITAGWAAIIVLLVGNMLGGTWFISSLTAKVEANTAKLGEGDRWTEGMANAKHSNQDFQIKMLIEMAAESKVAVKGVSNNLASVHDKLDAMSVESKTHSHDGQGRVRQRNGWYGAENPN